MNGCPKGHTLHYHAGLPHSCNICTKVLDYYSQYYCNYCDWDYCEFCYARCSGRHELKASKIKKASCTVCRKLIEEYINHCCLECDYYICDECYEKSNLEDL